MQQQNGVAAHSRIGGNESSQYESKRTHVGTSLGHYETAKYRARCKGCQASVWRKLTENALIDLLMVWYCLLIRSLNEAHSFQLIYFSLCAPVLIEPNSFLHDKPTLFDFTDLFQVKS